MVENWDPRFFFSEWKPDLITKLLKQQEAAKEKRNILFFYFGGRRNPEWIRGGSGKPYGHAGSPLRDQSDVLRG